MKLKREHWLIIIGLLFFLAGLGLIFKTQSIQLMETKKTAQESVLQKVDTESLDQFFQKKRTGFIYIGRPTCPYCKDFQAKLKQALIKNQQKAYYYDTDQARENKEDFVGMDERLGVKVVPTLLFISNGHLTAQYKGDIDNQQAIQDWLAHQAL
ncbi:thioredoxin fold domain-containing protein [Listeria ilorinensis]|uniref:thioredoxin fold domain-containing protein n=1 Tax=Listeria ilorinensis TaxID=2867439 RepID=UPI001EF64E0B|nr:thioredoxin fold domain-containing protein [Listeria ilorinensis]